MNLVNAFSGWKTYMASFGLVVLGIALIANGDVAGGVHSMLVGLAAFGIHAAVVNNAAATPASHPLLDQLWQLLAPVLSPPAPPQPQVQGPQTIQALLTAIQQPQSAAKP